MRILTGIDIPFAPFGGSPLLCDDWYSHLPDGIQVRFLTLPPPEGTVPWWRMDDVRFLKTPKVRTAEGFDTYVHELRREVARHVEEFRPTLIHCQHLNFGLSRAFAHEAPSIAKVGICHGTDVQSAIQSAFFLENLRAIRARMNVLLFPARRMAEDYFAVDPCDIAHEVIPHGIPDAFYRPRPDGPRTGPPLRVLYAGRLTPWKGADLAVEAMRYLPEGVHLTVIGNEDSAGYLTRLHAEVEAHGLHARVHFEAHLPRQALMDRFPDFDVCVFPSRRLEAFSLTTLEAQAQGTVVVYADAGGIADVVGDSGYRLGENTPHELARVLARLRDEPALLQEYRARGHLNAQPYRLSVIRPRFFGLAQAHAQRVQTPSEGR
jgi:glycosyltransferase involved in cell wall biosynthesis